MFSDDNDNDNESIGSGALGQDAVHAILMTGDQQLNLAGKEDANANPYPGVESYKQRIRAKRKNQRDEKGGGGGGGIYKNGGSSDSGGDREHYLRKKAFDQELELERLHFCYGEDAPSRRDVGIFCSLEELAVWACDMADAFPESYDPHESIFGDDPGPLNFGTKIRLEQIPDGTNHPLLAKVVGLKFDDPIVIRGRPVRDVHYIIKTKNDTDLSTANLCEVHEAWLKGWGDATNDDDDDDDDDGDGDDDIEDLLSVESERDNEEISEDEDDNEGDDAFDSDQESMNQHLYAKLGENWNAQNDGPFDRAFWAHMFTPDELNRYRRGNSILRSQTQTNQEQQQQTASPYYDDSSSSSRLLEARKLLMEIILAETRDHADGVILESPLGTKYLAMEFVNRLKRVNHQYHHHHQQQQQQQPILEISYAIGYYKDQATQFLHAEEKVQTITCSSSWAMNTVQEHIFQAGGGKGLSDIGSGLLIFRGYIAPILPPPMLLSSTNSMEDQAPTSNAFSPLAQGTFGLEFELSCCVGTANARIAFFVQKDAFVTVRNEKDREFQHPMFWSLGNDGTDVWQILHDGSLKHTQDYPNSNKFELVSPILKGQEGLEGCLLVLQVINNVTAVSLNKSMAMHLHVGVVDFSLQSLKNICDNFIRYEDAIDTFLPASRRTASNNRYCQSNKKDLLMNDCSRLVGSSKQAIHERIQACSTKEELFDLVNPNGRYYKLNLQNLKTNRQPTIEFRQHSATSDCLTTETWVLFCMALVHNSVNCDSFINNESMTVEEEFDDLFDKLVRDPALKQHYQVRRDELRLAERDSDTEAALLLDNA